MSGQTVQKFRAPRRLTLDGTLNISLQVQAVYFDEDRFCSKSKAGAYVNYSDGFRIENLRDNADPDIVAVLAACTCLDTFPSPAACYAQVGKA
jgi:hypothetical protein